MMTKPVLIYGSYGYTGSLIVKECKARGINVLLAGRKEEALQRQHEQTGFPFEVLDIEDTDRLVNVLKQSSLVIHCGGPFIHTAKQMVEACLKTGTHYTDITGEYQVFELLADQYDAPAKQAGIMVMPGTGFDVVPSDCLALYLKKKISSATHLQLAFMMTKGGLSRGTKKSMTEKLGSGSLIRRNGQLISVPMGNLVLSVDFGPVTTTAMNIPWGDISTAWRSTGIPNIEVYAAATPRMIRYARWSNAIGWLLKQPWVKRYAQKQIDKGRSGPPEDARETGRSLLWGRAWNASGQEVAARLEGPSGYALTYKAAVHIAEKILSGDFKPGYQTPAKAYGEDLILEIPTVQRTDA